MGGYPYVLHEFRAAADQWPVRSWRLSLPVLPVVPMGRVFRLRLELAMCCSCRAPLGVASMPRRGLRASVRGGSGRYRDAVLERAGPVGARNGPELGFGGRLRC